MAFLNYREIMKSELDKFTYNLGDLFYCVDTQETFIDFENNDRVYVRDIVYLLKEIDKDTISSNILLDNRIYFIKETSNVYKYDGMWILIDNFDDIISTVFTVDEYNPTTFNLLGSGVAPRTLASCVYLKDGTRLSRAIDDMSTLTVLKYKVTQVEVSSPDSRLFRIPYPVSNYDLEQDNMVVLINGYDYTGRYVVSDDELILNPDEPGLNPGEIITYVFSYARYYDLNGNTVLNTRNYADKSITTEKLADDIRIKPRNIVTSNLARLVTDDQINNWDGKANAADVYTKQEVIDKLDEILGVNTGTLETIKELADLINASGNASAIFDKFNNIYVKNEVYSRTEVDSLLNKKPNFYIQSGAPTTPKMNDIWINGQMVPSVYTTKGWEALGGVYVEEI